MKVSEGSGMWYCVNILECGKILFFLVQFVFFLTSVIHF